MSERRETGFTIPETGSWQPNPDERQPGSLCISARGGEARTWGLATIDRAELLIRDCPAELIEEAKALLLELAGWVVSSNTLLEAGEELWWAESRVRLVASDEGLELWEYDSEQGGFVPGLSLLLAGRCGSSC
jgi:hypothetical protein